MQLLRGGGDVEPPLAGAVARRAWSASCGIWSTTYGVDAVQMHDMDFFISEARTAEFAERIAPLGLSLVGARPHRHADAVPRRDVARRWRGSGLKMVFSGAESAIDDDARGDEQGRQGVGAR